MSVDRIAPTADPARFPADEKFTPIRLLEVDIGRPIPDVSQYPPGSGQRYAQALSLVWLHDHPLGFVELAIPEVGISSAEYARAIWGQLGPQIAAHLRDDGLPIVAEPDPAGLRDCGAPRCQTGVDEIRADGPFVTVVIPTRDRPEWIAGCVASLLRLDYPHFEIIIVDNGPSTTATADVIQQTFGQHPRVKYVHEARAGTSRARNRGLELAHGEITAFCDDDILHHPRWLTELVRGFGAGDHVGCVTGPVLPRELETPSQIWIEQYGGYSKGFSRRVFDLAAHAPNDRLFPFTTGRLGTGANMAFKTSVLRSVGGFDTALGGGSPAMSGEDLAISFQVIAAGYQLVYQPSAVVYHPHSRDYGGLRKQMYGYGLGLTAYLTKCVIDNPRLWLDMLRKLPVGFEYVFSPRSPKNHKKSQSYPRELTMIELKGMMRGPLAYMRGRWSAPRNGTSFRPASRRGLL